MWLHICMATPCAPWLLCGERGHDVEIFEREVPWRVERARSCGGCGQKRGEDAQELTYRDCRFAKVCGAHYKKMAWTKAASGVICLAVRRKDMCGAREVAPGCEMQCVA